MTEAIEPNPNDLLENVVDLVVSYVSHNAIPSADLPALIAGIHAAIYAIATGAEHASAAPPPEAERPNAAQIRKSVGQDGIVSFIDGKSYKTLKCHLSAHGLTPMRYRERYGLPADYSMVAPSYAEQRSQLAKAIGLGVPGGQAERQRSTRASA